VKISSAELLEMAFFGTHEHRTLLPLYTMLCGQALSWTRDFATIIYRAGVTVTCMSVQVLSLPSFVWKMLCGQSLSWTQDFMSVDEAQVNCAFIE